MPRTISSPLLALLLPTLIPAFVPGCSDSDGRDREPWTAQKTVALVQYESCDQLEGDLKARALQELDAMIESYSSAFGDGGDAGDGGAPAGEGDGAAGDDNGGGREEGTDYSGTNNQEDGVDEADLVKTDGYNVYVVNGDRLHVFGVPEFGQLVPTAEVQLEGYPSQLLLDSERDRAAVFSFVDVQTLPEEHPLRQRIRREQATEAMPYRTWGVSKISVFDIADPAAPELQREVWIEGWYQTARRTDNSVRVVTNGNILMPGLDDLWEIYYAQGSPGDLDQVRDIAAERIADASFDDLMPRLYERLPDGAIQTHSLAGSDCRSFYFPTDSAGRATTSILSFEIDSSELAIDADTVMSNWATVYASRDRLYLAESAWDWWWRWSEVDEGDVFVPASNIHAFDVSSAGRAAYIGSGRIDGTVVNQFALDEEEGLLRVAATTTPWQVWGDGGVATEPPVAESHIYVLEEDDGELKTVGHLGGIAPRETIFAARFLPTEAFLVTFEQIDPLFTIDLSNPREPRLVGELEVPGFSTYLHPLSDDRLLAIGVGGDENGANGLTQISMFDVSDRASPALVDTEELVSEGWGWSEAQYEHKAFQYFAPKKLLAVPMSSYSYPEGDYGPYLWHSRLELISVDEENGLERRGAVDHSRFFDSEQDWWGGADVRRSIFMGDYIYALSTRALTVNRLDDMSEVTAQELPSPGQPYWWW